MTMYAQVDVTKWSDLRECVQRMHRWAFRGQRVPAWFLATALERGADIGRVTPTSRLHLERVILRQFQRRAHIVLPSPPPPDAVLEWLALIQHHGGPTRLLDFTYSLYIAAFFALEFASDDAVVWAIHLETVDRANGERLGEGTLDDRNRRYVAEVERIVREGTSAPGLIPVEPDRLNERMATQKGLFLFPKDISTPFMGNLAAALGVNLPQGRPNVMSVDHLLEALHAGKGPRVVKIVLPRQTHRDAMRDLVNMNIDARTLFTGLDGFARSLNRHARFYPL